MSHTATATRKSPPAPHTQQQSMAVSKPNEPVRLVDEIEERTLQFKAALPAHIPVERFKRVLLTALQNNPTLVRADRRTLFTSAVKAAQDGLLPDGREGALVIYRTKTKEGGQEKWVDAVQWMPMIGGIRKKVRNSGEIATWDAQVVYAKDEFAYELGDDPFIRHKPYMAGDRGDIIAAYSIATLKSGEKSREVMTIHEIMEVWRKSSKQKDSAGNPTGPWKDHRPEMCRKTVARRHSKVLPMSTDLDDLIRRDDELYDMEGASDREVKDGASAPPRRPQLTDFTDVHPSDSAPAPTAETAEQQEQAEPAGPADAYADGEAAALAGKPKVVPPEFAMFPSLSDAWEQGYDSVEIPAKESR